MLGAAVAAPAGAASAGGLPAGLWVGPHNDVAVRTGACGQRLCGWVVWADPTARTNARNGGVDHLLGTELLQDYAADGGNAWSGTVFVPDMGRSFSSRIEQVAPDRLRIRGCMLGGLICRSQTWTRIDQVPHG